MRRFNLFIEFSYIGLFTLVCIWAYPHFRPPVSGTPGQTEPEPDTPMIFEDVLIPEFRTHSTPPPRLRPKPPAHVAALLDSVYQQLEVTASYDPAYVKLAYPGGDVPLETGVCTDVIVRAFRAQGVDLQQNVHEDMRRYFRKYPNKWGLRAPDSNIDHRRVPNLMTYFERRGVALAISDDPDDYLPGDVVAWKLNNKGQFHIGIVMQMRSFDEMRPLIGHNIDSGVIIEDVLFNWEIVGHYRYFPAPLMASKPESPSLSVMEAGLNKTGDKISPE